MMKKEYIIFDTDSNESKLILGNSGFKLIFEKSASYVLFCNIVSVGKIEYDISDQNIFPCGTPDTDFYFTIEYMCDGLMNKYDIRMDNISDLNELNGYFYTGKYKDDMIGI